MKKKIAVLFMVCVLLTGCGALNTDNDTDTTSQDGTSTGYTTEGVDVNLTGDYSDKGIQAEWSLEDSTIITLAEAASSVEGEGATIEYNVEGVGTVIHITQKGTYVFAGQLTEGQILVESDEEKNVQIVLNGVTLTNSNAAPIYIATAKNLYLTLAEGTTNEITDNRAAEVTSSTTGSDTQDETEEVSPQEKSKTAGAAIFSKTDLIINGTGSLTVTGGYNDGIKSKDDLQVISGTIQITSTDHGLVGKDSVSIRDGEIKLITGGDGIKTTNDEDTAKGNVIIDGGTIEIEAGDDGIDSVTTIIINAGDINITQSEEGLESLNVVINDGNVQIVSSDDGINISDGSGSSMGAGNMQMQTNENITDITAETLSAGGGMNGGGMNDGSMNRGGMNGGGMGGDQAIDGALVINGGTITVNAAGDGLDSNGDIQINGGETIVYGPTDSGNGALDYNGTCEVNSGVLILASTGGMEQVPSDTSAQPTAAVQLGSNITKGTSIEIQDASGTTLYTFDAIKDCRYIAVSAPELVDQSKITIVAGDVTKTASVN